ncbi:MAG TPA: GNAT family N-acetyltransferase [Chloroflexota bacterium]|nr:GNAT family N-acetyltransferase [Chloroflexota bacterium]
MSAKTICPAKTLRVHDDISAFSLLEDGWKELFQRHGGWNLFLSWQWFYNWWSHLGANKELRLLTLTDNDRLVGVVPLMVDLDEAGRRRLGLIGCDRTTDYADMLVDPDFADPMVEALAHFIADGMGSWDYAEFSSLREPSPFLGSLRTVAATLGLSARVEVANTCPVATLAPSWDEFLATLDKTHRHELRRKIRRSQSDGQVTYHLLRSPEEVGDGLEPFFRLHRASRPEKAAFLNDELVGFFRSIALSFAREGWMRLSLMRIDGRDVASTFAFTRGDRLLLYNSGLDPEYRHLSVGIALHAADLQQAIAEGAHLYDFLRGNEPYKYDLFRAP